MIKNKSGKGSSKQETNPSSKESITKEQRIQEQKIPNAELQMQTKVNPQAQKDLAFLDANTKNASAFENRDQQSNANIVINPTASLGEEGSKNKMNIYLASNNPKNPSKAADEDKNGVKNPEEQDLAKEAKRRKNQRKRAVKKLTSKNCV